MAYSLFGVFGLYLPVLYGESAENALGRLLAEVISKSGDTLILDWVGQPSVFHSYFPATIASYQTLPSQPLLLDPPVMSNFRLIQKFFVLRPVRKMRQALSKFPLTIFQCQTFLPCVVHHIRAIAVTQVDTSTAVHVHQILAMGSGAAPIYSERVI